MTTKDYLKQIEHLEKKIKNKTKEMFEMRVLASSISISNDADRVQSSGSKDKLGDSVAKIVDIENEISEIVEEYTKQRQKIIQQIDTMSEMNYYDVLYERYVNGESFDYIASSMGYCTRQVLRIHGEALLEFEKKYGETYLVM